jgi:hypothetical protein
MKTRSETRPQGLDQYHIQWCAPNDVWPNGGWSVYRINGDQIARSIIWERYNTVKGWPEGEVKFRHSWPGYLGMVNTWEGVKELIDADAKTLCTYVA